MKIIHADNDENVVADMGHEDWLSISEDLL